MLQIGFYRECLNICLSVLDTIYVEFCLFYPIYQIQSLMIGRTTEINNKTYHFYISIKGSSYFLCIFLVQV